MTPPGPPAFAQSRARRLGWIAALAFASGFPYGLVNEALPVYLRAHGAGLVEVGLVSAATFPWTFKFLWSPVVDRTGTRRRWIAGCLAALAALVGALAAFGVEGLHGLFWALLVAMVTLSATQDIAIDAYTIETTTTAELGVANSVRIGFYRAAMFLAGGLLVALAGTVGWRASFGLAAAVCGGLALAAAASPAPPRGEARAESMLAPLRALLARQGIGVVIVFALLFKLDIAALEPMMRAFWVDRGVSLTDIGVVLTPGRLAATIGGAVLGGLLTTQLGLFRALWSLGAVQALSALGYWWAAASEGTSTTLIVAAAVFESFAAGLGTSAFVAYLMSVCERRYAATQYAVLSALLALTRAAAGAASGTVAERLGYADYFLLTFALGIPAFVLLPFLARVEGREPDAAGRA